MPDSVCEQIRQKLIDILATVQAPNQTGTATILTVEEVDQFYNGAGDLVATIEQGPDVWATDAGDALVGQENVDQEFLIKVCINVPQGAGDENSFDRRGNAIAKAVRNAILKEGKAGGQLDNLVKWIIPRGLTAPGVHFFSFIEGAPASGIVIPFTARYTTALDFGD